MLYDTSNGTSLFEARARPMLHEWNTFEIMIRRESFESSKFKSRVEAGLNGEGYGWVGEAGIFYNLDRHEEKVELWLGKAPYNLEHQNPPSKTRVDHEKQHEDIQPGVIKDFKLDIETPGEGNCIKNINKTLKSQNERH